MKSLVDLAIVLIATILVSIRPAYAYLDPGTGSLILQGIIGTIAAAGFFLRSYLHKFWTMIRGKSTEEDAADQKD